MRGCKRFFVVASVLGVIGFLLGISSPAICAGQSKANTNPPSKVTPVKQSVGNCKYASKIDNSGQLVYMPAGKSCEQSLKDFTSQAKSCCICGKEGPDLMACKGDCCPIMFNKVDVTRNTTVKPASAKPAETAAPVKPAETAPMKPAETAPAKPAETAPMKPATGSCKYTTKMDNSGQVVYIPAGGECEQLLKVFASQNKSCCVGIKESADLMVYRGACCPIMFQPATKK